MNIKTGKGSISLAMLLAVWSVSAIASLLVLLAGGRPKVRRDGFTFGLDRGVYS